MEQLLTLIGSLASIGAAIWSFIQAGRSKSFAEQVRDMRDELVNRRKIVEVSKVYSETNRILQLVSRIGPTCTPASIKTLRVDEIAKEVGEYARLLNEQSEHFSSFFGNQARKLCGELREDVEGLAMSDHFEDIKEYGKSIYYKLEDFFPLAKFQLDGKIESATTVSGLHEG